MKEALDFLRDNKEVAFATVGEGNCPKIRVFQIMKMDANTLYFATSPTKRVYAELQENPAVEILSWKDNISVRVAGNAVFDVLDAVQQEIYNTNPVLPRLYADYTKLEYFRVEIDYMDYFDLTPTPPVLRHYDRVSGEYKDINPYGYKK